MSDRSPIEWTDATWNPVTGCTKVSAGCDHCYAETFAERFRGTPGHHFERGFDLQLRPQRLDQPLRWTRPRRIFVNSMSDLFHDQVGDDYIARVFAVMAMADQHTFQVLTKRHARLRSLLAGGLADQVRSLIRVQGEEADARWLDFALRWPLPNVWLGVSIEDQRWAGIRIPALLDTPAAVRWISAEPLLGPVDLTGWLDPPLLGPVDLTGWLDPPLLCDCGPTAAEPQPGCQLACRQLAGDAHLDWVVVGGESGPGARPMHPDWARGLRDQCTAAGVPFCFKQWGAWAPTGHGFGNPTSRRVFVEEAQPDEHGCGIELTRVSKHAAGRELDGRTWDEYPAARTGAPA